MQTIITSNDINFDSNPTQNIIQTLHIVQWIWMFIYLNQKISSNKFKKTKLLLRHDPKAHSNHTLTNTKQNGISQNQIIAEIIWITQHLHSHNCKVHSYCSEWIVVTLEVTFRTIKYSMLWQTNNIRVCHVKMTTVLFHNLLHVGPTLQMQEIDENNAYYNS